MKTLIALLILSLLSTQAVAHHDNHCSKNEIPACAHLMHEAPFTTTTEGEFIIHFAENVEVSDLKVVLWMNMSNGHGHGSAPVEIIELGHNMYRVQNAWFVMTGTWLVNISLTVNHQTHEISIPVQVKE